MLSSVKPKRLAIAVLVSPAADMRIILDRRTTLWGNERERANTCKSLYACSDKWISAFFGLPRSMAIPLYQRHSQ